MMRLGSQVAIPGMSASTIAITKYAMTYGTDPLKIVILTFSFTLEEINDEI